MIPVYCEFCARDLGYAGEEDMIECPSCGNVIIPYRFEVEDD
jgi:predicted RNA-binding Zn-ribbon protein involved in translation (DUF1610 family)